MEKYNLVIPLLILLTTNILISSLFLLSASVAYFFSSAHYDSYFVGFVFIQFTFRFYEFLCARKLYWYFQWSADARYLPHSTLLKNEDEATTFQL
ncbi:hypothetical protein M3Y94_00130100 [Aphelenchoides besseyi]|nr:hypothetical protein M3Y94_00130100 [Aphelenchoides besseyi]